MVSNHFGWPRECTACSTSGWAILSPWSLRARCRTVRELAILPVRKYLAIVVENSGLSALRYCSRRSSTFPDTGPCTFAINRPCSVRKVRPTLFSAQKPIRKGLPTSPARNRRCLQGCARGPEGVSRPQRIRALFHPPWTG